MSQLSKMVADIKSFHEKFELRPLPRPGFLDADQTAFRVKFLQEELDEFKESLAKDDLAGSLDALVDLVYVALGTAYLMNLPFDQAWDEVQRANMSKIRAQRAEDSKRGSAFDVVKPKDWKAPDIDDVIKQYELDFGGL